MKLYQPSIPPLPPGTSLGGKTIVITGGNSGLGWETARQSILLDASRVIITTRSSAKSKAALEALNTDPEVQEVQERRAKKAVIESFQLDLNDYQSGLAFAQRVKREVKELDILLLNAGGQFTTFERSNSGHELLIQVNCYTQFLIVFELLPLLIETAKLRKSPSRLTFVGSYSKKYSRLAGLVASKSTLPASILSHLDDEKEYWGLVRYSETKFVLDAFVHRLAEIVPPSDVIINNVCPGVVKGTRIFDFLPFLVRAMVTFYAFYLNRTPTVGAQAVLHACVLAGPESHGKFMQHNKVDEAFQPLLSQPAGRAFAEKLGKEIMTDVMTVDSSLEAVI